MQEAKARFLQYTNVADEASALQNCVLAAFRRNKLYWDGTPQSQRNLLRSELKNELKRLSADYKQGTINEEEHEANIQDLADTMSQRYGDILVNGRFNIGTSQKALNLYCKFLWCLGDLSMEPLHCPVDRIILARSGVYGSWTKIDDMEEYQAWIERLRERANPLSLASWELETWLI